MAKRGVKISTKDHGFKALRARIAKAQKLQVTTGVHGDAGAAPKTDGDGEVPEGAPTLVEVATWLEFGTDTIPSRSWLRAFVDEHEQEIKHILKKHGEALVKGADPEQLLRRLGVYLAGGMRKRIAEGIPPENADSTIRQKGSSKPLIDSGQFRTAIDSKVEPKK
jgi:hypothetical protein